ncbi:hypothetical protein [Tenacibaculum soleae]|uniref:hypothetical protein n=1 Tax=Tenacibaculum soleae TaxID=447689 RepID=UPI0023014F25|nr:hypothetical protein [Tenacibaculum soleae]
MKDAKKEVKELLNDIYPHVEHWDYRNDEPILYNHANKVALLCIDKQFELLRYLGSKTHEELYKWLVEQKVALKNL